MTLIPDGAVVRSRGVRPALAAIALLILAADQVTKALVLSGLISGDAGWAAVRLDGRRAWAVTQRRVAEAWSATGRAAGAGHPPRPGPPGGGGPR